MKTRALAFAGLILSLASNARAHEYSFTTSVRVDSWFTNASGVELVNGVQGVWASCFSFNDSGVHQDLNADAGAAPNVLSTGAACVVGEAAGGGSGLSSVVSAPSLGNSNTIMSGSGRTFYVGKSSNPVGFGAGSGNGSYDVVYDVPNGTNLVSSVEVTVENPFFGRSSEEDDLRPRYLFVQVTADSTSVSQIGLSMGGRLVLPGQSTSVFDTEFGLLEVGFELESIALSGGQEHSVSALTFVGSDHELDYDGDGRLSCADVAAFQTDVNGSPSYEERFDFDDDNDLDQADVDVMQSLVNAGVGAGLAGDANGDCTLTCADVELVEDAVAASAVFGDEEYSFAMDFDLDGDVDAGDLSALLAALDESGIVGDINGDCCVNTADLGLLYAKFGQSCSGCPEDLNGDGQITTADLGLLLSSLGAGCD